MQSGFITPGALACAVLLCGNAAGAPPEQETNINVNATECEAQDPASRDLIRHTANGVQTRPDVATPQWVQCAVPRTTPSTGTYALWINGDNNTRNRATTICSISSFSNRGVFVNSTAFSSTSSHYNQFFQNTPNGLIGKENYVSVSCLIPDHGNGTLRGVTWFVSTPPP